MTKTADPYADDVARLEPRLRGHVPDAQLNGICRLLIVATNYGAGDALAGYILRDVPQNVVQRAAELLQLDDTPSGGAMGALSLLQMKSADPAITEMLKELDRGSASGKGW